MDATVTELEAQANHLAAAARTITAYLRGPGNLTSSTRSQRTLSLLPIDAPSDVHQARESLLRNVANIQQLLAEPAAIVQKLAVQVWLPQCPLNTISGV